MKIGIVKASDLRQSKGLNMHPYVWLCRTAKVDEEIARLHVWLDRIVKSLERATKERQVILAEAEPKVQRLS